MKILLFILLFILQINLSAQQFTEQTSISLIGVGSGSVEWGDYDNDGDLDILLTGMTSSSYESKIYRNNGDNTFTEQTSISLTGVWSSSVAWGDYDNDGDLDILLTGYAGSNAISKIYRNNGDGTFLEQDSIFLTGVGSGSVAWGDYDNDGDLDILLTGNRGSSSNRVSKIYRNNGNNTFTEQTSISLAAFSGSSVAWGDYDNDGDLDILITGSMGSIVSYIYRNNGNNSFTNQTSIYLAGVISGSVAWGDYDNDGDLDILLTGQLASGGSFASIYRNNGNNTFTQQTSINLTAVASSSVAWGDYDNDGDLDILLTGHAGTSNFVSKIYRNNGNNTFTEQTSISLTGVAGDVAWGDYDNDGDLDILLTGYTGSTYVSKIYRNNNSVLNTLPSAPTNLTYAINGTDVTLNWNKSTDNETPQNGLKYNLVIGTDPNAANILAPMSNRNSGYRRIISLGNVNHRNSWTIKELPYGTYYWSVQAIDNAFAGSSFSLEQSFLKDPPNISVTSPNGGENWQVGTTCNITWVDNISENVKIDLWKGGFYVSTITTSATSNGSYLWTVPTSQIAGIDYKIRICSALNDSVFDFSDNDFTIIPSIILTSPNGGEALQPGIPHNITWVDNISENVKIDLWKGGFYVSTITTSATSNGSYLWTVPTSQIAGIDYKIRICSALNDSVFDFSDNDFTIIPSIILTSPNGGENWVVGTIKNITWTSNNSINVKLEYTTNSGTNWINLISSMPASIGIYSWTVPNTPSTQCKVRVRDATNSSIFDLSDNSFTITAINDAVRYMRIEFYQNVGLSSGNPNNYINPGNRIKFKLAIANNLTTNLLTCYGTIRPLTPSITVTDSIATFNNILAGNSGWSVDDYEIDVSSTLPFGTRIDFVLTVTQSINPTGPWNSVFSFPIAPLRVGQIFLDDDQFPDSWGNNNRIPEPGETIEVIPLLNNVSFQNIYSASARLATNLSGITVWNGVTGASGIVYDTWRYNVIGGFTQPIIAGTTDIQPELDYVFGYANITPHTSLPFSLYYGAYLGSNPGGSWQTGGILIKWENKFEMVNGIVSSVNEVASSHVIPTKIELSQNYPNPMNLSTIIRYSILYPAPVIIKIFDILGNEIETLINEEKPAGSYELYWHATNLRSGVYFYRMQTGNFIDTKKMILLK